MPRRIWMAAVSSVCMFIGVVLPAASDAASDDVRIERLIRQLGSPKFSEREAASKQLEAIGDRAYDALRKAATGADAETRRRARELVEKIEARRQERAIDSVRRIGGRVTVYQLISGEDSLLVSFTETPRVCDRDLASVKWPRGVSWVDLSGTQVTDSGLIHLRGAKEVRRLRLHDTQVTGAGLAHLTGLTELRELDLRGKKVTDEGLKGLRGLKSLRRLTLDGNGVIHLKGLTELERLFLLGNTKVTGAGLAHLKKLGKLTHLELTCNQVTDEGLVYLRELRRLKLLSLKSTEVTDAGLVHLKELKNLRLLSLAQTKVTEKGIADLRKALPDLRIHRIYP